MSRAAYALAAFVGLAALAVWFLGDGQAQAVRDGEEDTVIDKTAGVAKRELVKIIGTEYDDMIRAAADTYGLDYGVLWRLLYRESRFRDDIVTGKVRSSVGALGIAQFMPTTAAELGIDPLDPSQAIPGAALYLSRLIASQGSVDAGVAAYNWGPGNMRAFRRTGLGAKGQPIPQETVDYVANITGGDILA